jgi:2-(3-amino-3-carboxypropyl)histidine synthase
LLGTIQFNASLWKAKEELEILGYQNVVIPQERPRCAGESLGCTSPTLEYQQGSKDTVVYLCDGRFHMEAVMIANPKFDFFQYDPYSQEFTIEKYDFAGMMALRKRAVAKCIKLLGRKEAKIGVILSVLGRQGSPHILERMVKNCQEKKINYHTLLISEIMPEILESYGSEFDFFVQIGCPRLSVDWGEGFHVPVLTPYEFWIVLGKANFSEDSYPMDYYSDKGGEWTNYWHRQMDKKSRVGGLRKPKVELKLEEK